MEILNTKKNIVLGSKSPRRIELMKSMGLDFKIKQLNVDESYPNSLSPIKSRESCNSLLNSTI